MKKLIFIALAATLVPVLAVPRVLAAESKDAEALYQQGLSEIQEGRFEEAVVSLEKSISSGAQGDARLPLARLNLGIAYADLGRNDKAIEAFKAAIADAPDLAIAHLYLGTAYRLKDDYGAALPELLEALKLDPSLNRAHDELWQTYGSIGTRFGYDHELILRQVYHMEMILEKEPEYLKMFPAIQKELDILFGLDKRLGEISAPTKGRVFRKTVEVRPGTTAEKTAAELPPAPPLPADPVPPAEKAAAFEKAKAR
ncbi:MAG TPA: tetratricopeptide repeat protein [Candidatus Eisenbacteria bacterium]|nr:tetratricopeptide repeat protein [Candidatus Eisenbacteria bacterium]